MPRDVASATFGFCLERHTQYADPVYVLVNKHTGMPRENTTLPPIEWL